ncbi:hypothetical protein [Variovorax sp. N23]|uniref:hypothetical protein n=1 Tax=Variovorax sp. N23 TaxID=2980555 RepID=UPI0021C68479|nr:hypothetical protein [Variovorax sp. N23]MCU4119341.1 hypothetical protein [Variovorax sp. N23]
MTNSVEQLRSEARYAERLCHRTARLYRRAQTIGTFLTIVGGSGTLAALVHDVPGWIPSLGAILMAVFGAAMIAIRPGDKAAANESDAKRYSALLASTVGFSAEDFERALELARQSDAAEVEGLRNVAYNDVVREIGAESAAVELSRTERFLALVA